MTIVVDDVNDNGPSFDEVSYVGHIPENSPAGTDVILENEISTHDPDEEINSGNNSFILEGTGSDCFAIDETTLRVYFASSRCEPLDREEKSFYNLRLIVSDGSK